MHNVWIFSPRPIELCKPMPTDEGLHPMWRLMKPSMRRLFAEHGEPDDTPVSAPSGRGDPPTPTQERSLCPIMT